MLGSFRVRRSYSEARSVRAVMEGRTEGDGRPLIDALIEDEMGLREKRAETLLMNDMQSPGCSQMLLRGTVSFVGVRAGSGVLGEEGGEQRSSAC